MSNTSLELVFEILVGSLCTNILMTIICGFMRFGGAGWSGTFWGGMILTSRCVLIFTLRAFCTLWVFLQGRYQLVYGCLACAHECGFCGSSFSQGHAFVGGVALAGMVDCIYEVWALCPAFVLLVLFSAYVWCCSGQCGGMVGYTFTENKAPAGMWYFKVVNIQEYIGWVPPLFLWQSIKNVCLHLMTAVAILYNIVMALVFKHIFMLHIFLIIGVIFFLLYSVEYIWLITILQFLFIFFIFNYTRTLYTLRDNLLQNDSRQIHRRTQGISTANLW